MTTMTVAKHSLVRALKAGHLFASQDDTLPMLNAVHLTGTTDGRVIVQATDRYKLVASPLHLRTDKGTEDATPEAVKAHAADLLELGGVIISRPRVTLVLQWLAGQDSAYRRTDFGVQVTLTGGAVRFSGLGLGVLEVPTVEGEYPKLEQLLDLERWQAVGTDAANDYASAAAFSPFNLQALGKASQLFGNNVVEVALGRNTSKPVQFRVSTDGDRTFTYMLLMPVRLPQYDA